MSKYAIAPKLAVDADGYVWRVFPPDGVNDEIWSMAPVNPDNEPIPEPIIFYEPMAERPTDNELFDQIYAQVVEYLRRKVRTEPNPWLIAEVWKAVRAALDTPTTVDGTTQQEKTMTETMTTTEPTHIGRVREVAKDIEPGKTLVTIELEGWIQAGEGAPLIDPVAGDTMFLTPAPDVETEAVQRYENAVEGGLSDAEAREEGWSEPVSPID